MNLPAYPKYKDSGVAWLGMVPEGWEVKRLKDAIHRIESGTSVNAHDVPASNEELAVLKTSCVYSGKFNCCENKTVDEGEYNRLSCPLRKGCLIVSRMNTPELVGASGYVDYSPENIFLPDRLWQVYCSKNTAALFLYNYLSSLCYRAQVKVLCAGTSSSMQNLSQDNFLSIVFTLPPLPEQEAIVAFLDRETAKIDALVEKQQRMLDLLKEKRTALISHAVTKGLNPEAKLKDSGVAWLGMVPEGWEVKAIWHVFFMGRGRVISHEDIADNLGEYPVYSSQTEDNGVLGRISTYDFEGDYITWTTDGANAGTVFCRTGRFNCTNVCGTLKPKREGTVLTSFVAYALSGATAEYVRHDINPKLMNNVMAKIRFPLPPLPEQQAIAAFLDCETAKIDTLAARIEDMITKLQEYRTALITAVVTGKVRCV